jgi:ABC-type dipeptide/oligopeptide/nickel transport system permease subunit
MTLAGALVVAVVSLIAVASIEWGDTGRSLLSITILSHTPYQDDRSVDPPSSPDSRHPLGTDSLGRDLLSRLLHGARVSLFVGVTAEAIALLLGITVGAAAAGPAANRP